jgi:hypothetical protein
MSYPHAERNERNGRFHALVLAIALHLALAGLLYVYTSEEPSRQMKQTDPARIEQQKPAPQPRA